MRRSIAATAFALLLATVLCSGAAEAASFDCAKAGSAREKLICHDPALSAADDKLAAAFRAVLKPLSPAARKELRQGQQSWLRFIDKVCDPRAVEPLRETPATCLRRYDALRQRQLDHATVTVAGLVISRVERFAARPAADIDRFVTEDIAYPQIDRPRTEGERGWNAFMREAANASRKARGAEASTDLWRDYRIVTVTPMLIAVSISKYIYSHGAAHGMTSIEGINWLLAKNRPLEAHDLFARGTDWRGALARLAATALSAKSKAEKIGFWNITPEKLAPRVADPHRWTVEREGLGLQFEEYEVGPYVIGAPKVVIPWRALRAYLRRSSPLGSMRSSSVSRVKAT